MWRLEERAKQCGGTMNSYEASVKKRKMMLITAPILAIIVFGFILGLRYLQIIDPEPSRYETMVDRCREAGGQWNEIDAGNSTAEVCLKPGSIIFLED